MSDTQGSGAHALPDPATTDPHDTPPPVARRYPTSSPTLSETPTAQLTADLDGLATEIGIWRDETEKSFITTRNFLVVGIAVSLVLALAALAVSIIAYAGVRQHATDLARLQAQNTQTITQQAQTRAVMHDLCGALLDPQTRTIFPDGTFALLQLHCSGVR